MSEDKSVQPQDEKVDAEVEAEEQETEVTEEEESTEEISEEQPESEEPKPRPVYTMPVAKAQEEKRRAVEKAVKETEERLKAEMSSSKPTHEETEDMIEKVANEQGLDPTAARAFADAIRSTIKVPDTSKYDRLLAEKEEADARASVAKSFTEKVIPLIHQDFPQATPEHIASVQKQIEELSFTPEYNTYRVEDIYAVRRGDFAFRNDISAESASGHGPDIAEFKILSDEEQNKLAKTDPETFKRYVKWEEGQHSKFA